MNKSNKRTVSVPYKRRVAAAAILAALVLTLFSSCTEYFTQEPRADAQVIEAAGTILRQVYADREFDYAHNMANTHGLVNIKQFNGPMLYMVQEDGSRCVSKDGKDEAPDGGLPEGVRFEAYDRETVVPQDYRSMMPESATEETDDGQIVFALFELTGYYSAGTYDHIYTINGQYATSSKLELFDYRSRVSFYDLSSGEMLAWIDTTIEHTCPQHIEQDEYASDGYHNVFKGEGCTLRTEPAQWEIAFKELFYDENGYQVIGTRLLSVPKGVDTIVVPEGVTQIEPGAAAQHTASALILPEGLETIGREAFMQSALRTVDIPQSVRYIGADAFADTPWIDSLQTQDYVIVGSGVLLDAHAEGDALTLPADVRYVAAHALDHLRCRQLTIPETVLQLCGDTTIEDSYPICSEQTDLQTLIIRGGLHDALSVSGVAVRVVNGCPSLKAIVVDCDDEELYAGLYDDWLYCTQEHPLAATIYCTDESYANYWAAFHSVTVRPLSAFSP